MSNKETANASSFYTEALTLSEKTDYQNGIAKAKLGLAQCHIQAQEYEDAENLAIAAFEGFEELNLSNQIAKTHAVLSKIYEKQQKTELAFDHYKSFVSLHDSIMSFKHHQNGLSSQTGELLTKVKPPKEVSNDTSKWSIQRLAILSGVLVLIFLTIVTIRRRFKK